MIRALLVSTGCALFAMGVAGCGSFSQPYPDKNSYAFRAPPPEPSVQAPATQAVAIVGGMIVSRPYDGQGFVYRIGDAKFETDYYNGFISPPERLLAGDLAAWLHASNIFAAVGESGWTSNYRFVVRSHVLEMYGDYRDKEAPKAFISMKIYLIDDQDAAEKVLLQKVYTEQEPAAGKDVEALVAAWEQAWQRMLGRMLTDIHAAVRDTAVASH